MEFKSRKIPKGDFRIKNRFWRKIVRYFGFKKALVLLAVICFAGVTWASVSLVASIFDNGTGPSRSIFSFGGLDHDDHGHTNLLFLGVAGDAKEGGNLSDSIMLVSINPNGPSASFINLPRDLFIGSEMGDRKVNEIYANARFKYGDRKGLEIIKDAIAKFAGVDVHYGAAVSFHVFEEIVDTFGGIEVFVPQDIQDPFYPDGNYGYETFVVRKGIHHFDGKTALKYARSRKTSSDYDRARRQQDLILALKKKAMEDDILTDFGKLKKFYKVFKKHINTDLGVTEIIALAKLVVGIDYNNSITAVLNDDPNKKDGFLYTPAREFYGGQFVLLPENLRDTQIFMNLVLIEPEVLLEKAQISVLNGTGIQGKAGDTATRLRRFGFHVIETGNYDSDKPVFRSFIRNFSGKETAKTSEVLAEILDAEIMQLEEIETIDSSTQNTSSQQEERLIDIQIVLGTN